MSTRDSVAIVHSFWDEVWNAHDASAVDRFVVDDFVIVSGGVTIEGRDNFKRWIEGFLANVDDLHLEAVESFQNADGSRVASRWLLTGRNNGFLGTAPDHQDIAMTGTAVWAVRDDGKLLTNWVERASWELHQRLTGADQQAV
ncbi:MULTISPECIES: ester cyclase [unclassified Mycobacterium]|uniref:ester cyclase n=1 Tax=unclassified Mycobacterium TaxID=2642494 RepID=UPI0029C8F690|nr:MULTISPECIES: nuclear transport factor 2 family protein [unclassified Mycobacterium]